LVTATQSGCKAAFDASLVFSQCNSKGIIDVNALIESCEIDFEVKKRSQLNIRK
jgi:hypothetical protein